jgi:hypothetical protein
VQDQEDQADTDSAVQEVGWIHTMDLAEVAVAVALMQVVVKPAAPVVGDQAVALVARVCRVKGTTARVQTLVAAVEPVRLALELLAVLDCRRLLLVQRSPEPLVALVVAALVVQTPAQAVAVVHRQLVAAQVL